MKYSFGTCVLDGDRHELRLNGVEVPLEPQAFDLLMYLIRHRDRLVSREELLDEVWGTRFVTLSTLSTRVKQVRRAVGDDGRRQEVIRTVHGRGFRFVAPVTETTELRSAGDDGDLVPALAGRDDELAELHDVMAAVEDGAPRLLVITGEPGVGKTTLVDEASRRWRRNGWRVLRGACIRYTGTAEPYLPLLEAIADGARAADGSDVVETLVGCAPTWLVQFPWLLDDVVEEDLRRRLLGSSRERMLREGVELLAALARARPLVLVVDDLQWSDPSTLDVVALLTRRRSADGLAVVATCRADAVTSDGSAGRVLEELSSQAALRIIPLDVLDLSATQRLVATHLATQPEPDVVAIVHERAGGSPLHVKSLLDDWMERSILDEGRLAVPPQSLATELPTSLRRLIERRLESLDPEDRQVLDVAAVAGSTFSAALVAVASGADVEECEIRLARLARHRFLVAPAGVDRWPDGTTAATFRFEHAVYREAIYAEVPPTRRAKAHHAIGVRLEQAYAAEPGTRSVELLDHYLNAGDIARAVPCAELAARQALDRGAAPEALEFARTGLELARALPPGAAQRDRELAMTELVAPLSCAVLGWSAPEAKATYERAHELAANVPEAADRLPSILWGLATLSEHRAEYHRAAELVREVLEREELDDDRTSMGARELLACSLFHQGDFAQAATVAAEGAALYDPARHRDILARYGENPGVGCFAWGALATWYLGDDDRAVELMEIGLELARRDDHAFSLANAQEQAAVLHQLRGDIDAVATHASAAASLANEQGVEPRVAVARILALWAAAEAGDVADSLELREALVRYRSSGSLMDLPYFLGLAADVERRGGDAAQAEEHLRSALAQIGARPYCHAAELHRRLAVTLVDRGASADAVEAELARASKIAKRQSAPIVLARVDATRQELLASC
jgi:DNA-binding winged helix-turn-helix (wHTH) protein/tetratricopeptide (TPR) repeat protein